MTTSVHRRRGVMVHIVSVFILFMLPELIMSLGMYGQGLAAHVRWGMYIKSLVYVGVFYLNYFVIIDATLGRAGRRLRFGLYNALVILAAVAVIAFVIPKLGFSPRGSRFASMPNVHFLHTLSGSVRDILMLVLTIALSVAVRLGDRWQRLERRQREIEDARREEELRGLKSQLNPHFLFNTLNSIYAMIEVDATEAQKAVHRLSGMLRHMLYDGDSISTLDGEVAFVRNYIDLKRMRLARTPVVFTADIGGFGGREVPPLLFLTPVENALKYGNTGNPDDEIRISITAGKDGITFATENRYYASDVNRGAGGIGISNLRRRLHLIYGDSASLEAGSHGEGVFRFTMKVPFPDDNPKYKSLLCDEKTQMLCD